MQFQFNDGGRLAAGRKGLTGDCIARAIAIAAELPYLDVYNALASGNKTQRTSKRESKSVSRTGRKTASHGIFTQRTWFKKYMMSLGFEWTPTMFIGQGCKVHLTDGELPQGRLVVALSKHMTAVIDGVINDTYDPQREVHWSAPYTGQELKRGQEINEANNTINWIERRCVYGYYKLKDMKPTTTTEKTRKYFDITVTRQDGTTFKNPLTLGESILIGKMAKENKSLYIEVKEAVESDYKIKFGL